ncbi:Neuropilin-1 [Exaiptasia diaphana]|nr:Neuropilin-1 [Exaiptasia diaphana]
MESGVIPDSNITASSNYGSGYAPAKARLNFVQDGAAAAWASASKSVGEWIQVDLGKLTNVTGIATQGNYENEWVTSYSLKYSVDGTAFTDYESGKKLTGNTDINTVVKNDLLPSIYTRYIRLRVESWKGHPSMRMELYGVICK